MNRSYECGKIKRLHVFDHIFLASQPQPADFVTAQENGIKTVINLREEGELDWDEAGLVEKLGMEYAHMPFKSAKSLTDDVFKEVIKILEDKKRKPVILHCSSADRVGAVWLAHRLLDGLTFDEAYAEAKSVGPRSPAYVEKAKSYVDRRNKMP